MRIFTNHKKGENQFMKKQIKWTAALSTAAFMTALTPSFSAPAMAQASGWVQENGIWMFYDEDGYSVTDTWKKHDGHWYYLDEDGELSFNCQIEEYYVDAEGKRVTNQWVKVLNEENWDDDSPEYYWYYYGSDGKATTSRFRTINDKTYYFDGDGRMTTGLAEKRAMLTIIINWIYILFTCFCMGFVFFRFAEKYLHFSMKRLDSVCMAGFVIAAVYAQIFSLFGGVGMTANLILIAACFGACIALRQSMASFLKNAWENCPLSRRILISFLFFVWSYFTSRGYMVPDMNLYHGQSIHWIEEYGVVKGLGNLHMRFGYNSSIFALSALYSMKFLLGRSLSSTALRK